MTCFLAFSLKQPQSALSSPNIKNINMKIEHFAPAPNSNFYLNLWLMFFHIYIQVYKKIDETKKTTQNSININIFKFWLWWLLYRRNWRGSTQTKKWWTNTYFIYSMRLGWLSTQICKFYIWFFAWFFTDLINGKSCFFLMQRSMGVRKQNWSLILFE